MRKLKWGVLSTALIGTEKVIPGMQRGELCDIIAISSRDLAKARSAADELGIPRAYGSYQELLDDPEVEAVYNPLPNHLHVPWSIKALQAGKHVLCEKPVAPTAAEGQELVDAARDHPDLKVMEAFMYRFHPQWVYARQQVQTGGIGELRAIQTFFSYYNDDPHNIRNIADIGGGGLLDIGCYAISLSRFIFGAEPTRVSGLAEFHPGFGFGETDRELVHEFAQSLVWIFGHLGLPPLIRQNRGHYLLLQTTSRQSLLTAGRLIYKSGRECPGAGPRPWTTLPDSHQPICSGLIFSIQIDCFLLPGTTSQKRA